MPSLIKRSNFVKVVLFISLLAFLLLDMTAAGLAGEGESEEEGNPARISTSLGMENVSKSGIDNSPSSFAYTEYSADLEWQFLLLRIDQRYYDWDSKSKSFFGNDPFDSLTRITPGVQYYSQIGDKWGVWAKMEAAAGFEEEVDSGSWSYNPQLIGIYSPLERTTLYAGVGALSHKTDDVVYPVLGLAWNMDAGEGLSFSLGFPENMIRYSLNEDVAIKLDFQWDIRFYQLAPDNSLVSQGYLRSEAKKPGLHFNYTPIEDLLLDLGFTGYLGRSLTIYDKKGKERISRDVSNSGAITVGAEYKF